MPATKRKSDDSVIEDAKRSHISTEKVPSTKAELEILSKEELVETVLALHNELAAIPRPAVLTKEQLSEKTQKARSMMVSGISKQMKWIPKCKIGTARFSYEGHVANTDVFLKLFRLPADNQKKMMQVKMKEFEKKIAGKEISASLRYTPLYLTGDQVNVRWTPEEGTFKVSGTYGLLQV